VGCPSKFFSLEVTTSFEKRIYTYISQQWLNFLCQNHPGFKDIRIDPERLAQLPLNNHVLQHIRTVESDEPGPPPDQGPTGSFGDDFDDADFDNFDTSTVPQTRPMRTEAESLRLGI
jgi:ATP-dependent DNA helicase PIF1